MSKKKILGVILLLAVLLVGCKESQQEIVVSEEPSESIDYVAEYQALPKSELFTEEWQRTELANADKFMTFTDYIPNIFPKNSEGTRYARGYFADSEAIYSMDTYYENGCTVYLNKLDAITREISTITYTGSEYLYLADFPYKVGGRIFATTLGLDYDSQRMNDYRIVELLPDGSLTVMANVIDVVAEHDMIPGANRAPETSLYYEPANDRYYMLPPAEDKLILIDKDGQELVDLEVSEAGKRLQMLAPTEEGRLIFMLYGGDKTTVFYYDGEERITLFEGKSGPETYADILVQDMHNQFIFVNDGNVVISWDIATGDQKRLYVGPAMSLYNSFDRITYAMRNTNGEILIMENNNLRIADEKGNAKNVTVSIKPFIYCSDQLSTAAKKYAQTHPGVNIDIQPTSEWATRDHDLSIAMQEIAAGGGPDILLLNRDYMLDFNKNKCLLNIENLLPEATKKQLIPGVLDYGKTDDGVMLLSNDTSLRTMFVNKKYIRNSSWTLQDFVAIIEEREAKGDPFTYLVMGYPSDLFSIVTDSVRDSEFVDMEKGTCNFDTEFFVKLLEICKRYDSADYYYGEELYKLLKEDKLLAYMPGQVSFRDYSEDCAALGEEYVTVGYPSLSGNGNRVDFFMGFAVNKNTENYEVIADFVNWMFSGECVELLSQTPARKDIYDGRIVSAGEDLYGYSTPMIQVDSRTIISIAGKPDGTSYVNEYMELLGSCHIMEGAADNYSIESIMREEAEAFFSGSKSAAEVAKIIQSRVSLYLMENY